MKFTFYHRLMWNIFQSSFHTEISKKLDIVFADKVIKKSKKEYRDIIERSKDIGNKNMLLSAYIMSVLVLSIYKSTDSKITEDDMFEIFSNSMKNNYIFVKMCKLTKPFNKKWQDKQNDWALKTQNKKYTNNWVVKFVYGKDINSFGYNYSECGICKLFKNENCFSLAKQMCKFDYVQSEIVGMKLDRTKTIANGDDICDFLFTKI